jgi:hypothetical protein
MQRPHRSGFYPPLATIKLKLFLLRQSRQQPIRRPAQSPIIFHGKNCLVPHTNHRHCFPILGVSAGSRRRSSGQISLPARFELDLHHASITLVSVTFHFATAPDPEAEHANHGEGNRMPPFNLFFIGILLKFIFAPQPKTTP